MIPRKGSQWILMALMIMTANAAISQVPTISQTLTQKKEVGLTVGQKVPSFKARDQFGREQTSGIGHTLPV